MDFVKEMQDIVIRVTMRMLIGDDFQERVNIANYINKNKQIDYIQFCTLMSRLCDDLDNEAKSIMTYLFEMTLSQNL